MADLFQIGLSGVYSSQAALATTGHNISNVNTAGYSRQMVEVSTAGADRYGNQFIGRGSIVSGIERAFDQFAFTENVMNTSKYSFNKEIYMQNSQLDMLLSSEGTSATKPVLEMFSSANGVADHPNMLESRTVFLENASNMVNQYNNLYKNLEIQYSGVNADIENSAEAISLLANNIAQMNSQLASISGSDNANDLLDQRNQAITQLSEFANVSVTQAESGMVNVYVGSGQALVMGVDAQQMIAINGDPDPSRKELALNIKGEAIVIDGSKLGGKVGGLFDTRDNDIERAFNQLGQNVIGLTHAINEQQKQGQTLDGSIGGDLFNDINALQTMKDRVLSHSDGNGTAELSLRIDDLSQLSADEFSLVVDDYQVGPPETLSFTVTNNTTGETESVVLPDLAADKRIEIPGAGFSIGIDSISPTDPIVPGKEFTLRPTRLAAQEMELQHKDPALIAAADAEIKAVMNENNTGDAEFRVSSINDKLDPLYMDEDNPLTIKITSSANPIEYDVVDKNGTIVTDPTSGALLTGLTAAVDPLTGKATFSVGGVDIEMEKGMVAVGDEVDLNFNETGEGDNRNILKIADLQSAKIMNDGKATFQDVYSGMLSEIGAKTANAAIATESSSILLNQSFERIQSVSGVNMDEEAANLLMYQQHYSAAARVISIAGELFDTILQSAR